MKVRMSKRARFTSQAMVMATCQNFNATIIDLSLTGLFIKTNHDLPVGHRATISIIVPSVTRDTSICLECFVVRKTENGIGFKFKPLDHESFAYLRIIINNRKRFSAEQLSHFEISEEETSAEEKLKCACIPAPSGAILSNSQVL